jgi:oligogalacturonide lyase
MVGHEYWHADGLHLGYHGWADATDYLEHRPGARFFGRIRFEGTDALEVAFPYETGHVHSNDFSSIVGDGMGGRNVVRLWKWNRTSFDEPRVLCEHRSSFHIQKVHVHPRFSPDGRSVLFTSDRSGYGNLYYVPVPDLAALPLLSEEG